VTDENGQNQRWVRTNVVVEDHFIVPKIKPQNIENSNAFLEDYVSDLMKIPLDTSRPLWELHLLDLKTSDAENVAVLKIHHSVGDGMSIMSLVLACMRKTSNPDELPSLPYQYRSSSRSSLLTTGSRSDSRLLWLVKVIWTAVILGLNTVCDALEFIVTTLFVKDTETPIKGDFLSTKSKQLRLVHRTVSLDDIKLTKNAMNMVRFLLRLSSFTYLYIQYILKTEDYEYLIYFGSIDYQRCCTWSNPSWSLAIPCEKIR